MDNRAGVPHFPAQIFLGHFPLMATPRLLHQLPALLLLPLLPSLLHGQQRMDEYFGLNGITPFHEKASADPAVRAALWETLDRRLRAIKEAGATAVRVDMWWSTIEPAQGDFHWEFPDRIMEAIAKHGLEPYPILCYNSAWEPDRSPWDWVTRQQFADYAARLVDRYRHQIRRVEVWNEPDLDHFWHPEPNPRHYSLLLQETYGAIKRAVPEVSVAGFCTVTPNDDFAQAVYDAGAHGYFDAMAFHHYNSEMDERNLEYNIRRIRRLMALHGDADKPLLLTEMGYSTGPSPVVAEMTPDEQAEWAIKAHLVALAQGVDQFYYFKLKDDPGEPTPDGYWGLLDAKEAPKPLWDAYTRMTSFLQGSTYEGELFTNEGAAVLLFSGPAKGEARLIAWQRAEATEPVTLAVPTGAEAMELLDGEKISVPKERQRGALVTGGKPLAISNFSAISLDQWPARPMPEVVLLAPGQTQEVAFALRNPTSQALRFDPAALEDQLAPLKVHVLGAQAITVGPGQETTATMRLAPPEISTGGGRVLAQAGGSGMFSLRLDVMLQNPFVATFQGAEPSEGGALKTWWAVRNGTDQFYRGGASLREGDSSASFSLRPGKVQEFPQIFRSPPAASEVSMFVWDAERGEKLARARLGAAGTRITEDSAFSNLAEAAAFFAANDATLAKIALTPETHQLVPPPEMRPIEKFSGDLRFAFSEEAIYVRAEVRDPTPLMNPHERHEIWRGDGLELYLGFDGPTRARTYGPNHRQAGINPGNQGARPVVWNWQGPSEELTSGSVGGNVPGAAVFTETLEKGYRFYARLPLDSLNVELPEKGGWLGFDLRLNNRSHPRSHGPEEQLLWNGTDQNWRDPGRWGVLLVRR